MNFYHWEGQDLIVAVHVQARASQTGIVGVYGDRLKVKITAPPVEGQANAELGKLFAKLFGVAKSQVTLLKGQTSKDKLFRIVSPQKLPDLVALP